MSKIDPYKVDVVVSKIYNNMIAPHDHVYYIMSTVWAKQKWSKALLVNRGKLPKDQEKEFSHSLREKFAKQLELQLTA